MEPERKDFILVADTEPLARTGLIHLINSHPQLHVCGEAETLARARELCERLRPRVLVLDWGTGEICSFMKDMLRWSSETRVVVITRLHDALSVQRAFKAGARGYVTRQDPVAAVISAILAATEGRYFVGPHAEHILLEDLACGAVEFRGSEGGALSLLSNRELQVFRLIGHGEGTRRVAEHLGLSVKTVETHRERIKTKLHLPNGAELVRRAMLLCDGTINPDTPK